MYGNPREENPFDIAYFGKRFIFQVSDFKRDILLKMGYL